MKKALVLLLCALAVFAIVSCKQDPPAPETFKVTFETGAGATQIDPVTVEKDAKVAKPADPTKLGSVFGGWFTEAECTNGYNFDTPVTKSFTLYAKWTVLPPAKIAKMTVTTGLGKDVKKNSHDKVQFNIDLRDVLGEDGGIQSGDVVTLKFRTSRDIYQYDIRTNKKVKQAGVDKEIDVRWVYETFRGTLADPVLGEDGWYTLTYTFGDSYYTSKTKPNYETDQYYNMGINFRGYLLTDDVFEIKDVVYTRGERSYSIPMKESYNAASSFISYAEVENHEWTIPKTQVLVYFADAKDEYPLAESVAKGGVPKGLEETGYTFEYFSDSGKTTAFDMTAAVENDVELYVTKTAIPTYTVTFNYQDGSDAKEVTVYEGDKVEEPEEPTRDDYVFWGWFNEAECKTVYNFDTAVEADTALYAKWAVPAAAPSGPIYKLTATKADTRFQFKWDAVESSGGKVFSLKYKADKDLGTFTVRDPSGSKYKDGGKLAEYTNPAEDGWIVFSYEIPEGEHTGLGLALFESVTAEIGDVLLIGEIKIGDVQLTLAQENSWYGNEAKIEVAGYKLVGTKGTTGEEGDPGKNNWDKISLQFDSSITVKPGDVLSFAFKMERPESTASREMSYSIRDPKKWFSEKKKSSSSAVYPQWFSTFETKEDGWTYVTYIFPSAEESSGEGKKTEQDITYPSTFRVDFRDSVFAVGETLYVKDLKLTSGETVTNLGINPAKTGAAYAAPTIEYI